MTAVRSCWAAAFAVDALARLDACGLPLDALELALLIQPELQPDAGGTARVIPAAPGAGGSAQAMPATGTGRSAARTGRPADQASTARFPGPAAVPWPGGRAATGQLGGEAGPRYLGGRAGNCPGPVNVIVDGVAGHPGALLAGWAEGASARVRLADPGAPGWPEPSADGPLTGLVGPAWWPR